MEILEWSVTLVIFHSRSWILAPKKLQTISDGAFPRDQDPAFLVNQWMKLILHLILVANTALHVIELALTAGGHWFENFNF